VPQFFLITSARALQAEFLDTIAAIECPLAEAIAAGTGADSQRSIGPVQARPGVVLRSTATSWRRTRSSMPLDDGARGSSVSQLSSRLKIR
jgi:hypothetical protein